jgi:anaerobic magnesium-protoporphyrin IX monomethyl ester cyclase
MFMHKCLLIYPPVQLLAVERARPDGSLGLLYLAASLEKNGIHTDVIDATVGTKEQTLKDTFYRIVKQENGLFRIGMEFEDIAQYVKKNNYDYVGIHSNMTAMTRMAFETAKAIKATNPNTMIIAGGVNAKALHHRFLSTGNFDAVCLTEGELILPRAIIEGFERTPGFAYRKGNQIHVNPVTSECFPESLDELPMPAWEKLPFEKYEELDAGHGNDMSQKSNQRFASMMTSRGCVWQCKYCYISTEKKDVGLLRLHSIPRVMEEIKKLKSLNVKKLFFEDATLLAKKERVKQIFSAIKGDGLTILDVNGVNLIDFFDRSTTINGKWKIDIDYIQLLKDAGFAQLVFPLESGCQRILNKYATGKVRLDKMDVVELMGTMTKIGIKCPVNIIIGFPDESEDEITMSISMGKKLKEKGAPYVSFFAPVPFPGSVLHTIALEGGHLNQDFDTDMMNWKHPIMKNTLVPQHRVAELVEYANDTVNDSEFIKRAIGNHIGTKWKEKT